MAETKTVMRIFEIVLSPDLVSDSTSRETDRGEIEGENVKEGVNEVREVNVEEGVKVNIIGREEVVKEELGRYRVSLKFLGSGIGD